MAWVPAVQDIQDTRSWVDRLSPTPKVLFAGRQGGLDSVPDELGTSPHPHGNDGTRKRWCGGCTGFKDVQGSKMCRAGVFSIPLLLDRYTSSLQQLS